MSGYPGNVVAGDTGRHQVLAGRRFLGTALSEGAINALIAKPKDDADLLQARTPRESMVLQLAAEGDGNTEAAQKLFISPRTAETNRTLDRAHMRQAIGPNGHDCVPLVRVTSLIVRSCS